MLVKCIHCGSTWSGFSAQHCSACHFTFSSDAAGDKHRVGSFMPKKPENIRRCLHPKEAGLVLKDQGGPVWGIPVDPEAAERFKALKHKRQQSEIDELIDLG